MVKPKVKAPKNEMEYSDSWYKKLPWKRDPETAARMAAEAYIVEKHKMSDDEEAYLEDVEYDEVHGSSSWKRDKRSIAAAFRKQKWEEEKMAMADGMYNKKSKVGKRGSKHWKKTVKK